MTCKAIAIRAIRKMPEKTTLEQISEEIAILASIERGRADVEAGRVRSHEEVKKLVKTWKRNSK